MYEKPECGKHRKGSGQRHQQKESTEDKKRLEAE